MIEKARGHAGQPWVDYNPGLDFVSIDLFTKKSYHNKKIA